MTIHTRPVLVLAIALALSACGAAPAGSPSVAEPTAAQPTQSLQPSEPECPYSDGAQCRGPLAAGGPYKTRLFVPVFSHHVGEGWDNIVDSPTEYHIMRIGPDGQPTEMGIYIFRNVAIQAATCEDKPEPGVGRTPAEMAAHLGNHVGLVTTAPEAVNVGGLDGVRIDVAIAPSWTGTCHYSEGQPNVPLFWGSDADAGLEWSIGPGAKSRFYLLAMSGGGNVMIDISAYPDGAAFEALLEVAVPVVESITFDPNYY